MNNITINTTNYNQYKFLCDSKAKSIYLPNGEGRIYIEPEVLGTILMAYKINNGLFEIGDCVICNKFLYFKHLTIIDIRKAYAICVNSIGIKHRLHLSTLSHTSTSR